MPSILTAFGYKIYFWTNENNEPVHVHVHVSKGKPVPNATKIWLTATGGTLAVNSSRIPKSDLAKLEKYIGSNFHYICQAWYSNFGYLTYYC